jgi:glycosyltransferase involved in cell wall biosynthesis
MAKVVIGMPVYNGAAFVRESIESILAQSLTDLRLVIGDNASTDGTSDICREYAASDERVAHTRHAENLGAHPNYNYVYQPDGAPYFKWAGHDDVLEPTYLERCVELLDARPELAMAHTQTIKIFADDHPPHPWPLDMPLNAERPHDRLWRLLWVTNCQELFAVLRTRFVDRTELMGYHRGSDTNFLADLLLLGDVGYVDEYLFKRRMHPQSFTGGGLPGARDHAHWFHSRAGKARSHPGLTRMRKHIASILSAPLDRRERLACLGVVVDWGVRRAFEEMTGRGDRRRQEIIARAQREQPLSGAP